MNKYIKVIGIDCATKPTKTGLSLGEYSKGDIKLMEVKTGNNKMPISESIKEWVTLGENILVAIDAPLGWPQDLGEMLNSHNAGTCLRKDANHLFRRETDRFVKKEIGIQSLDVGADRIARTAHAALNILDELRHMTGEKIELSWNTKVDGISAIEVYPAATLASYRIVNSGYKDKKDIDVRAVILEELQKYIKIKTNTSLLLENADALDATICLLAAKDFLDNNIYFPIDLELSKKEGWIWVKRLRSPYTIDDQPSKLSCSSNSNIP